MLPSFIKRSIGWFFDFYLIVNRFDICGFLFWLFNFLFFLPVRLNR